VEAAGRDLNQVWTNLIDNAADAMDGSGKLTITARREGSDVVVTVADTGPGIPEETVARIFDPFFTTKEPGKGTGLGLHTVHNIVSRSGGTITVRSDGSGTAFEVRLPAVS
jgi:signal transduction histidine kinase